MAMSPPRQRLRSSGSQSPPTTGRATGRAVRARMRSAAFQTILLPPVGVESDVRPLSPTPEPPRQRLRSSGSQLPPTTGRTTGRAVRARMRSAVFQTILLRPVGMESDVRPLTCTITELVGLVAGHDSSEEIGTDLAEQTSDVAPTAAAAELWFPIASHNWESYRQSSEGPDEVRCLPDHPPASCGGGKRRQAPLTHTRAPTAAAAELWFPIASHNWESYRQSSEGPDEVRCLPDHPPASWGGGKRRQAPLTHTRAPTAAAAELWFPIASHDWENYRQSSEGPDEVRCLPDHPPASWGGGKRRQAPLTHTRAPTASGCGALVPTGPTVGQRSSPVLSGSAPGLLRSAPVCSGSALDLLWICSGPWRRDGQPHGCHPSRFPLNSTSHFSLTADGSRNSALQTSSVTSKSLRCNRSRQDEQCDGLAGR